ncbi:MAG: transposase [Nevskia sp.]|jgi:putative transposase|nr:transposase [Nevskia sp.]MCK9386691.1 transposase [Nevskia sp.]
MSRPLRYEAIDLPQHVIQRGNNRQATFFAEEDYAVYRECLKDAADRHECDVHAYVLMTNHVHVLMTPHQSGGIGKVLQSVGRRYVQYVNTQYRRTGTLWEGRYKASLIDSERYLLTCYRYIEMNPVRAGMVKHPDEYRWSSYAWHAQGLDDTVIRDHPCYLDLANSVSGRQSAYRRLLRAPLGSETLAEIRDALNQCRVYGGERFKDEIEAVLGRRVRPGKAGRPRKELQEKGK